MDDTKVISFLYTPVLKAFKLNNTLTSFTCIEIRMAFTRRKHSFEWPYYPMNLKWNNILRYSFKISKNSIPKSTMHSQNGTGLLTHRFIHPFLSCFQRWGEIVIDFPQNACINTGRHHYHVFLCGSFTPSLLFYGSKGKILKEGKL